MSQTSLTSTFGATVSSNPSILDGFKSLSSQAERMSDNHAADLNERLDLSSMSRDAISKNEKAVERTNTEIEQQHKSSFEQNPFIGH